MNMNPRKEPEQIRLNRYLSRCGLGSRRKCEKFIKQGRVSINGETVTDLSVYVTRQDKVYLDGQRLTPQQLTYIVLNKPKGVITTLKEQFGRTNVAQLVRGLPLIKPVGRLDMNTTGVLLMTNDGKLHHRLTHPRFQIPKVYQATVKGKLPPDLAQRLQQGIALSAGELARARLLSRQQRQDECQVKLELREGLYREIRRLFQTLGCRVTDLDRLSFASVTYQNLPRGKWRYLTDPEVAHLKQLAQLNN